MKKKKQRKLSLLNKAKEGQFSLNQKNVIFQDKRRREKHKVKFIEEN
jgi:hypothetical protein